MAGQDREITRRKQVGHVPADAEEANDVIEPERAALGLERNQSAFITAYAEDAKVRGQRSTCRGDCLQQIRVPFVVDQVGDHDRHHRRIGNTEAAAHGAPLLSAVEAGERDAVVNETDGVGAATLRDQVGGHATRVGEDGRHMPVQAPLDGGRAGPVPLIEVEAAPAHDADRHAQVQSRRRADQVRLGQKEMDDSRPRAAHFAKQARAGPPGRVEAAQRTLAACLALDRRRDHLDAGPSHVVGVGAEAVHAVECHRPAAPDELRQHGRQMPLGSAHIEAERDEQEPAAMAPPVCEMSG